MNLVSYCLATGRWHQMDAGCTKARAAGPGEGMMEIPDAAVEAWRQARQNGYGADFVQDYITQKTGLSGTATRNVLIDEQGKYAGATLICCATCNPPTVGGCALVPHDLADEKWAYDAQAKTFSPPPADPNFAQQKQAFNAKP